MKKILLTSIAATFAVATPSVAAAQEAEPFIGVSAGYHDLGLGIDEIDGVEIDDASPIFGVVAGVDVPVGSNIFVGVEGNFHFGTDVIDNEYGASARLGIADGNGGKYYIRGGYQEVDIDPGEIVDVDLDDDLFDGIDTSEGDYLVGVGADIPVGPGALRLNVDTIAFDSVRATTGFVFKF